LAPTTTSRGGELLHHRLARLRLARRQFDLPAVQLSPTGDDEIQDAGKRISTALEDEPGVEVGGSAVAQQQANEHVEQDLRRAEVFAFPILFLLSVLFFRSLVAAALPLLVGGLTIVGTMLMLSVASELGSISIFALNLVIGLGLGLAIDYSLFIVSRYREEIAKTGPGLEAMRRTTATAGRTVMFSSLTVAGALASLLVFPQRFLYSMGIGGSLVALIAAGVALIVLPAILSLLGTRVNALAPAFLRGRAERDARPAEHGFWHRLSRLVMRFPGRIAIASAAFLIALGIPFFSIKFTSVDAQVLPDSASANQVDDALRADFPPFRDTPIQLAVSGGRAEAETVARDAAQLPGVAEVRPPTELDGGNYVVEVVSSNPPLSQASEGLVADLRALEGDAPATGSTAGFVDLKDSLADHLPLMLAIVVAVTLVVLFLFTGSVVLPVKQILMNLLGLSAVFGILVLIFQDGRLEGLLRLHEPGRARGHPAAVPVRRRLRAVDRLRRLPAVTDQGGPRPRRRRLRSGRYRSRARRTHRHRRGGPVRRRDRGLRHLRDDLHQAARARDRPRRADRRDDRPRAARSLPHGDARRVELVGAQAAPANPRQARVQRGVTTGRQRASCFRSRAVASVSTTETQTIANGEHQLRWSGLLRRLLRLGEAEVCA